MPCLRGWLRLPPEPRKVVDVSTTGLPDWVVKQCEQRGIRATQRGLAEKAGTYAPTVKRVLEGRGDPDSVKAVAHALGMDLTDFAQRIGYSNELGPWEPPAEAHRLGAPEREALGVLIRAIADGGQTGVANLDQKRLERETPAPRKAANRRPREPKGHTEDTP